MNVVLLYTRILKKFDPSFPEQKSYAESSKRFLLTYTKYKPNVPHRLVIVNCGRAEHDGMFDGVAASYATYSGGGYDCGTYQAVARQFSDADLILGLNTHTYFWREGWLEPFIKAAERCGPGLYGATASYESYPHLRTPSIAFHPKVMAGYPLVCNSRNDAVNFEAGQNNIALWAMRAGYPTLLVAADGEYVIHDWRNGKNIFRRGNQSNCLIWDRHTEIYRQATVQQKRTLESMADTVKWELE